MNISLKKFLYHKDNKTLSADASELGCGVGEVPGRQIWKDSCDFGIKVESPTGKSFTFLLDEERDQDCWVYEPYEEGCPVDRLIIYND